MSAAPHLVWRTPVQFRLGPVVVGFEPEQDRAIRIPASYSRFLGRTTPDVSLDLQDLDPAFAASLRTPFFDSDAGWVLQHSEGGCVNIVLRARADALPRRIVSLDADLASGVVYLLPGNKKNGDPSILPYPLWEPLDNILTTMLLSQERGILIHACGISIEGQGLLFLGDSGAGKSTLARLWSRYPHATVLSDDHIIVAQRQGSLFIYGTPWHSRNPDVSASSVPLTHLFSIEHAPRNQLTPLRPVQSCTALMTHSFPTYWDKEGMAYSLKLAALIAEQVPGHRLGFVPTPKALDFVLCATTR